MSQKHNFEVVILTSASRDGTCYNETPQVQDMVSKSFETKQRLKKRIVTVAIRESKLSATDSKVDRKFLCTCTKSFFTLKYSLVPNKTDTDL